VASWTLRENIASSRFSEAGSHDSRGAFQAERRQAEERVLYSCFLPHTRKYLDPNVSFQTAEEIGTGTILRSHGSAP